MMKLRNLMQVACMATAALTAFSCSQEEFENSGRKGNITVNACLLYTSDAADD